MVFEWATAWPPILSIHVDTARPVSMGQPHLCLQMGHLGVTMQGSFAEYFVARADRVRVIPSDIDMAVAALTEPVCVCLEALAQAGLSDRAQSAHHRRWSFWPDYGASGGDARPGDRWSLPVSTIFVCLLRPRRPRRSIPRVSPINGRPGCMPRTTPVTTRSFLPWAASMSSTWLLVCSSRGAG